MSHPLTRPATTADISAISAITRKSWEAAFTVFLSPEQLAFDLDRDYSYEPLRVQMEDKGHVFILLEQETVSGKKEPLGYVSFGPEPGEVNTLTLHKLYLNPDVKGQGNGKKLLDYVCNYGVEHGYTTLKLWVNRQNEATRFYKKQGFTVTEEVSACIGEDFWRHDYVMEKVLSQGE